MIDGWLFMNLSYFLSYNRFKIQDARSKVKNIDSSPLQNTCSNILLQLGLIYRTIHSAFGVIPLGVIFILWFCIDPVLTVYSFHVKKKCLTLVITKNKRHKKKWKFTGKCFFDHLVVPIHQGECPKLIVTILVTVVT